MIFIRWRGCVWTCAIIWVRFKYSTKVGKIFVYICIIRAIPAKCQPDLTIWTTIKSSLQLVPEIVKQKKNSHLWIHDLKCYHENGHMCDLCSWQRKSDIIYATWCNVRKFISMEKINLQQLISNYIITNHLTNKLCHRKSLLWLVSKSSIYFVLILHFNRWYIHG